MAWTLSTTFLRYRTGVSIFSDSFPRIRRLLSLTWAAGALIWIMLQILTSPCRRWDTSLILASPAQRRLLSLASSGFRQIMFAPFRAGPESATLLQLESQFIIRSRLTCSGDFGWVDLRRSLHLFKNHGAIGRRRLRLRSAEPL